MRIRQHHLALVVIAAAAVAFGLPLHPTPAVAAVTGAGISGITPYGGYLGNYIAPDGTRVYCIDPSRQWPSGTTGRGIVTSSLTTDWGGRMDAATLQRLNYVLTRYGQTGDSVRAAAVSAYVYAFTSHRARVRGAGYDTGLHFINGNTAVERSYAAIWEAAQSVSTAALDPTATITIELTSPRTGVVRVATSIPGVKGTLTLHGAVVAESGASSLAVTDGDEIVVRGTPAPGALAYEIAAAALFTATSPPGPSVTLYSTGNQQRTIRHAPPAQISLAAETRTEAIALPFTPTLRSQVERPETAVGEPLIDSITVALAEPEDSWPEADGQPLPIVAVGTVYGPLSAQPVVSDVPPVDAPILGSARIMLTGPGEYFSDGTLAATSPGYYTWVWTIVADDQSELARAALGEGFAFADRFGLPAETVRVMAPAAPPRPELAATGSSNADLLGASYVMFAVGVLAVSVSSGIAARRSRCALV